MDQADTILKNHGNGSKREKFCSSPNMASKEKNSRMFGAVVNLQNHPKRILDVMIDTRL
jgi:hypothetical protein